MVGGFCRVDGTLACYNKGGNAIAELGLMFNASSVLSLPPTPNHGEEYQRVDGTLIRYSNVNNAIAALGLSFIISLVYSISTHHNRRGGYCG
jgi:hypothetical protein